jgi:hypothetical protein
MPRIAEEQDQFREDLVQEHYSIFCGRRLFCQATLNGFWLPEDRKPTKVHAHHIQQYAVHRDSKYVHHISNGILLGAKYHQDLHDFHRARYGASTVAQVTKELVTMSFHEHWRDIEDVTLFDGAKAVDAWEALLVSKNLLEGQREVYAFSVNQKKVA